MSSFLKVRIATFIWGFFVTYLFTRRLDLTSVMFLTMVIGNTIIMKLMIK